MAISLCLGMYLGGVFGDVFGGFGGGFGGVFVSVFGGVFGWGGGGEFAWCCVCDCPCIDDTCVCIEKVHLQWCGWFYPCAFFPLTFIY